MIKRFKQNFTLTQKEIDCISEVAKENKLTASKALSKIISEHNNKEILDIESALYLVKKISMDTKKIRKSTEIQQQVLNSMCIHFGLLKSDFFSTDDFLAELMGKAKEYVDKKIETEIIRKYTKGAKK